MKIRNGFVSNSSSSSFVLVGQYVGNIIDKEGFDLSRLDFNHKNYVCFGGSLSDAEDVMDLTKEMAKYIIDNKDKFLDLDFFDGSIFETVFFGEDGTDINIENLYNQGYKELRVLGGYYDYHSSESVDDLEENYFN